MANNDLPTYLIELNLAKLISAPEFMHLCVAPNIIIAYLNNDAYDFSQPSRQTSEHAECTCTTS